MTSEQGGAIANRQGNILEQQVRQAFASHGFREVAFAEYEKLASGSTLPGVPVPDLLVRRVPYQSIYGHRGVTEFLAVSASRGLAIRIECKWQQSQGSVDEKFPYLYLNCIQAMPEREIILLIDGNGYKPGALAWLKQAVASQDAKLIHVFNLVGTNRLPLIFILVLKFYLHFLHFIYTEIHLLIFLHKLRFVDDFIIT